VGPTRRSQDEPGIEFFARENFSVGAHLSRQRWLKTFLFHTLECTFAYHWLAEATVI